MSQPTLKSPTTSPPSTKKNENALNTNPQLKPTTIICIVEATPDTILGETTSTNSPYRKKRKNCRKSIREDPAIV